MAFRGDWVCMECFDRYGHDSLRFPDLKDKGLTNVKQLCLVCGTSEEIEEKPKSENKQLTRFQEWIKGA
jgi:hypothetical protein